MSYGHPWYDSTWAYIVGMALCLVAIGSCSAGFASVRCTEVGEVTQRNTEWRLMSGCYVEVEGRMIPRESWRGEQELAR